MKIRLVKKKTIAKYQNANALSRSSFDQWIDKLKSADWETANDIKETYGSADLIGKSSKRVVFNIGGNNYRMICKYHFGESYVHLFINWIGTHSEYNNVCKDELQYTINVY
jgi:mRNA interferase HigB